MNLDFNERFTAAINRLENTSHHVFITGKAGTGKSTLLQYFRQHTSKNVAVLAPTGVAAVNVKGQTIHSFFRFKPDITPQKVRKNYIRKKDKELFRALDTVIIDEISMVRSDLLDCIDVLLRMHARNKKKPFGGVQMIFFGDLYQLPPVVGQYEKDIFNGVYASPYFFDAKVFESTDMDYIDLEKIYRQQDDAFIGILNAIRTRTVTSDDLRVLNRRYIPEFHPGSEELFIHLTTTNVMAERINAWHLRNQPGQSYHFEGRIDGKFEQKYLPTRVVLDLKINAQVMLLNNDPQGRWINGTLGKIIAVEDDLSATSIIQVQLEDGRLVEVTPFTWEMFRFMYNEETESLESRSIGSFTQYPLKLAWAVTIHKSQGKTFSRVILDMGQGAFSHGQTYVALSRCISLEGLVLKRPIVFRDILLDERITHFMQQLSGMTVN